jgi:chitin disaccharide deacetylase
MKSSATAKKEAKPRLVLNADDFGKTSEINSAISDQFANGCISSASVMPNGEAFAEACDFVHRNRLSGEVGIHLTLDEGFPLSQEMLQFTDSDGRMCLRKAVFIWEDRLKNAVYSELRLQILRAVDNGIRPGHLDSHHHLHTSLSVGNMVVSLAREFGIGFVRRARDISFSSPLHRRLYNKMFNSSVLKHVRTTDKFCDVTELYECGKRGIRVTGMIECMCHFNKDSSRYDNSKLFQSDGFRDFLTGFEIVSFTEIS